MCIRAMFLSRLAGTHGSGTIFSFLDLESKNLSAQLVFAVSEAATHVLNTFLGAQYVWDADLLDPP